MLKIRVKLYLYLNTQTKTSVQTLTNIYLSLTQLKTHKLKKNNLETLILFVENFYL